MAKLKRLPLTSERRLNLSPLRSSPEPWPEPTSRKGESLKKPVAHVDPDSLLSAIPDPPALKEMDDEIKRLRNEMNDAVAHLDYETAAALRHRADELKKKKESLTRDKSR